ncbi:MAG: hypothetical protein ACK4RK_16655 [Gemmataceae bacterium]
MMTSQEDYESTSCQRREFLRWGSCLALGGGWLSQGLRAEEPKTEARPFRHYADLLRTIERRGHRLRVLGYAPDKSPIVVVQAGGDKKPAIFISAGSHSTEHAGVVAAVELIDQLRTKHQVYVIPCRDPIGLNGFRYAMSLSLGTEPDLTTLAQAEELLRDKGDVLHDTGGTLIVVHGEYGYANHGLYRRFPKGEPFLDALKGRRLWYPSVYEDVPGSGLFERAYTLVITPDGEILHLNRFHDTPWAPAEVRATRNLMRDIQPGLTFDLHEYGGDAFWFSARRQRTEEDEVWESRMAREAIRAVAATGTKLADDTYSPGSFFSKLERGVYWLDPSQRGEGLNLADYAAARHGPAFTVETGMRQPFPHRVRLSMLTVQTAVKVFEERYA